MKIYYKTLYQFDYANVEFPNNTTTTIYDEARLVKLILRQIDSAGVYFFLWIRWTKSIKIFNEIPL